MKFLCKTNEFLQALHLVSRAIGNQQALPILGNILIEAKGSTCTVSATDLELSIITQFEAKIENEGSVTVPAKAIVNFAQYNSDDEVLLETIEGTQLKCTSAHAKTSIAGEAATDYPTITGVEKQTSFGLAPSPLLLALHLVTFASAKTSLRPVLSGVYLRSEQKKLILAATDSYRLSEFTIANEEVQNGIACIIPTKILEELKVILGSKKGDKKESSKKEEAESAAPGKVDISLSKQQIEIRVGNTRLLSRLIDGKFPDYHQIIPQDTTTKVYFNLPSLLTAVKRMHYFAKEMNNNLTFHCAEGQTRVMTPQTQIGRDEATLATEVTGTENKIALSSSYLLDFLGHIDGEGVEMRMIDSMHPAVFRLPGEDAFLHLIMPLRMQQE